MQHVLKYVGVHREEVVQYDCACCLVSRRVSDLRHLWDPAHKYVTY